MVLWNNQSLAKIRDGFINLSIKPIDVSPMTPNFQGLAQSLGWIALRVTTPEARAKHSTTH